MKVRIFDKTYSGKALYDILEHYARKGYYSIDPQEKQRGEDILWFIWKNKHSPVFGKERMATFERYFIDATETHEEPKNAYYRLFEKEEIVDKILKEFGLPGDFAPIADFGLLIKAVFNAEQENLPYHVGNVLTSDLFYEPEKKKHDGLQFADMGVLAVEMETAALYANAALGKARALSIMTVSDSRK